MSGEPRQTGSLDPTGDVAEFLEFLDDLKPPLFVEASITAVLRTEPPIRYGVQRVVEIVGTWAERRAAEHGQRVCDAMLGATRKIVEAYRSNTIGNFDPKSFYRPFVLGLLARCPVAERDELQAGLRSLQESMSRRWAAKAQTEFAETETVEVRGQRLRREQAIFEIVKWLEEQPYMPEADFDAACEALDQSFATRVGLPLRQGLVRLVEAASALFNGGQCARAARLFAFVSEVFDRLQLTPTERADIRGAASAELLDFRLLSKLVADEKRVAEALPIVRHFADLAPGAAIDWLESEPSRERRRFLLNVVELHGAEALPIVLARLDPSANATAPWYLTRNLIYLLSRIDPQSGGARRAVLNRLSPYLSSPVPQLRGAALAALKRLGGRETLPHLLKMLDAMEAQAQSGVADRDVLERHLAQTFETLVSLEIDSAVAVVAEVATGVRGDFGLGRSIRDTAIAALAARTEPLPARAVAVIVQYLRQQTDRKLKFVVGSLSLGVDLVGCRRLMPLVADSSDPAAVEVLATPLMRKLATKGTGELIHGLPDD